MKERKKLKEEKDLTGLFASNKREFNEGYGAGSGERKEGQDHEANADLDHEETDYTPISKKSRTQKKRNKKMKN